MKIINITFSNINNLKGGPHVIPFDRAPLESVGIFAIIGPTGSGKSTILDVITLALFNRIPRFKKSISKGEVSDLGSVITHHTDSASASVSYEINRKKYTSTWSISKARTGNFRDYEMTLADESGTYFDLKKSEVPNKNEQIIGLKYDQFIKSIILSQGQFAKFVKADKNERGQLLENLTGTGIYRQLGRAAYAKHGDIKKEVELKKEMLGDLQVLTDDSRVMIIQEISEAEKTKINVDKEVATLQGILQIKQEILNLKSQISRRKIESESIQKQLQDFEVQKIKLATHEKLLPLKGDIAIYIDAKENASQIAKNLKDYNTALDCAEVGLKDTIAKMSQLTGEPVDSLTFKVVMSDFQKEINTLVAKRLALREKGADQRNRISTKLKDLDFEEIKNPNEALIYLEKVEKEIFLKLNEIGLSSDSEYKIEKQNLLSKKEGLKNLEDYHRCKVQLLEVLKLESDEKLKVNEKQKVISEKTPILQKSELAIKALIDNGNNLQKRKEDAIKIASLEKHRSTLVDGEACPLCGSVDHPYSEHGPDDYTSDINTEIIKNKESLDKEVLALNHLRQLLTEAQTSLNHSYDIISKNKLDVDESKKKVASAELKLEKKFNSNDDIEKMIIELKIEIDKFEDAVESLPDLKLIKELTNDYQELNKIFEAYKEIDKVVKSKYAGEDVDKDCNDFQDEFNNFNTSKSLNKKSIEMLSEQLEKANKLLAKTEKELQPHLLHYGYDSIEQLSENYLLDSEYQELRALQESLTKRNTEINTQLKGDNEKLSANAAKDALPQEDVSHIKSTLQNIEIQRDQLSKLIGEKTAALKHDDEQRTRKADRQKEITKLNKLLDRWSLLNQLIGDAKGNKFSNFAQGLTLQNLLVYTNRRLANLTDRYLLDMPKDEGSLTVIDQYQGNTVRAVSTLSGGETFLISLALALSLSDMASRNVSLDSLFIDEGFGTLDQETLDVALDTLETLQTESQKTVGIISHVEALKERINVQIKLEKNALGYSTIKIVS